MPQSSLIYPHRIIARFAEWTTNWVEPCPPDPAYRTCGKNINKKITEVIERVFIVSILPRLDNKSNV